MNLDFNIWHEEVIWGVKNLGQQHGNCSIFLGPCAFTIASFCRSCKTWITQTQIQLLDISLLGLVRKPLFSRFLGFMFDSEIITKSRQILYFCACVLYAYHTCNHRCAFFLFCVMHVKLCNLHAFTWMDAQHNFIYKLSRLINVLPYFACRWTTLPCVFSVTHRMKIRGELLTW